MAQYAYVITANNGQDGDEFIEFILCACLNKRAANNQVNKWVNNYPLMLAEIDREITKWGTKHPMPNAYLPEEENKWLALRTTEIMRLHKKYSWKYHLNLDVVYPKMDWLPSRLQDFKIHEYHLWL